MEKHLNTNIIMSPINFGNTILWNRILNLPLKKYNQPAAVRHSTPHRGMKKKSSGTTNFLLLTIY